MFTATVDTVHAHNSVVDVTAMDLDSTLLVLTSSIHEAIVVSSMNHVAAHATQFCVKIPDSVVTNMAIPAYGACWVAQLPSPRLIRVGSRCIAIVHKIFVASAAPWT